MFKLFYKCETDMQLKPYCLISRLLILWIINFI